MFHSVHLAFRAAAGALEVAGAVAVFDELPIMAEGAANVVVAGAGDGGAEEVTDVVGVEADHGEFELPTAFGEQAGEFAEPLALGVEVVEDSLTEVGLFAGFVEDEGDRLGLIFTDGEDR